MNTLVIGANGKIGHFLISKLESSKEHYPVAMVRKEDQKQQFEEKGIETRLADLEGTIDDLVKAFENIEAIVFTAGSGGSTGADKTMLIDLDGAVKSMKAAEKVGIKRFIIISAIGIQDWHESIHMEWMDKGAAYSSAKYYADIWLKNTDLDYTIIRPGGLTNSSGSGKIKISEKLNYGQISREDVASTIVSVLSNDNTIKREFDVVGGESDIEEVIKTI